MQFPGKKKKEKKNAGSSNADETVDPPGRVMRTPAVLPRKNGAGFFLNGAGHANRRWLHGVVDQKFRVPGELVGHISTTTEAQSAKRTLARGTSKTVSGGALVVDPGYSGRNTRAPFSSVVKHGDTDV
jgi:hypothetical protein